MKINGEDLTGTPKLKDEEFLRPLLVYLLPSCNLLKPGETLFVYRTQDQIPINDYGQAPRARRRITGNAVARRLSDEEVNALSPKKREKLIGEWGLSCNDSEESAMRAFFFTFNSRKEKGASPADLEAYVKDRGRFICRYKITSESGLITQFDEHGHANLYLYEGVNLESLRDKDYDYKTIDYQIDED